MKTKFLVYVFSLFSLLLIGIFYFYNLNQTKAVNEYVLINYPPANTVLENPQAVSAITQYPASWGAIEMCNSSGICSAVCNSTIVSSVFSCSFSTTSFAPGNYSLRGKVDIGGIQYLSAPVSVIVEPSGNTQTDLIAPPILANDSNTQTTTKTDKPTPTPAKVNSPTPEPESSTETIPDTTPTPKTTLTLRPIQGRPDLSPIPATLPVSNTSPTPTPPDFLTSSEILSEIKFDIFQGKVVHLENIQVRELKTKTKFFQFAGKSLPNSLVKITLMSQPMVMSATADSSGNWAYTLQKSLEPGKHEIYLEINNNNTIETSGPYPFNIARAQATADNPTGTSYNIVDPQKLAIRNYVLITLGIIAFAILVLMIFVYLKRTKITKSAKSIPKETGAAR